MSLTRKILIRSDLDAVSRVAAELFIEIARRSIEDHGRFSVALSGGSTPRSLYELLAAANTSLLFDWEKVFFFFTDERNVPESSPESNYRMATESLLSKLPLDPDSVRPWSTIGETPENIAKDYDREIRHFFGGDPRFDLILLGLGSDAHTASLFPHSAALQERDRLAVKNWVEKLGDFRFTMTFPLINKALNAIFLVSGEDKANAVARVLEGDFSPDDLPAQFVLPENGALYWLMDEAAASELRSRENLLFRPAET